MKKKLMLILLMCATLVPVAAQTEKSHILIYKLDSTVDTLLLNNVRNIYHSCVDINGVTQPEVSTLRLRTVDGERVYPLTEIDYVVMPKSGRVISFMGTSQSNDNGSSGAPRRTAITGDFPDGQTYLYQWVTGDYIYLSTGDRSRNVEYPHGRLADKTTKGEFTFASDTLVADQYIVFYTGTNRGTNDNPIPYNKVKVATTQTQVGPDNSDHLGASGDCGIAPAIRQSNSNYKFELAHKTAVLCFMPRIDALGDTVLRTLRLKQVAVKADKDIAGIYTLSPEGLSATPDATTGSDTITLLTNNFNLPIPHQKETAQDSVASYMVVAPQTGKTSFKVYYRIYDVQSELDTVVVKNVSINNITGAKVYPVTHRIDPHIMFAAQTDSVHWDFGAPATVFGSVNMPLSSGSYTGFIWGSNKNLSDATTYPDHLTPNSKLSFKAQLVDDVKQKAYYYRAYAYEGGKYYYGKIKKFGMDRDIINMGTSVRWSSINMGAITAEDAGDQYAWGEKIKKTSFTLANYSLYHNNAYDNIGMEIAGNPEYDVVTAVWRGCWRMPTKSELHELVTKCNWEWVNREDEDGNLRHGLLVKNRNNNADSVIFLPAAGYCHETPLATDNCYYMSGTRRPSNSAHNLYQYNNESNMDRAAMRWEGLSIRPVFESNIEKNGQYLFIRSDSISYSADHTTTKLYGTMRGLDDVVTNVTQGFVVGKTQDVTLESGANLQENVHQTAADNGTYFINLTEEQMSAMSLGDKYYVRAYLTYDGSTYYGEPLTMAAMTITADSTNWQVGMDQARLCGTVTGISEAAKSTVDIGFVVGTTPDVEFADADEVIVCDSTVNNKFVCEFKNMQFKQYYYRAFVRQGGRHFFSEPRMLGLEFVDLGLPSGLRWANINVGSQTPMDKGDYYAWGEVKPQPGKRYNLSDYDPKNDGKGGYDNLGTDINGTLYDAAQVNWHGPWRMPTAVDAQELYDNCTVTRTTLYGANVWKFTSKINGNTIYLPGAGYYNNGYINENSGRRNISWTSTAFDASRTDYAYYFSQGYNSDNIDGIGGWYRHCGMTVRPVAKYNYTLDEQSMIQMTTDGVEWEVGGTTATLHGYLLGLRYNPLATESGIAYSTNHISDNADSQTAGVNFLSTNNGEIANVASGNIAVIVPRVNDNTVYYYRTYVKVDGKYYYANEREFGRRMVKLFDDSNILWSNVNMGASSPDDSGDYYAWGETETKSSFTKSNYTYTGKMEDISGSSSDVVHVKWGGIWRMPTRDDVQELLTRCTWTEVTKYGQPMYKIVGPTGDSLFIAKSGSISGTTLSGKNTNANIWTSNLNTTLGADSDEAYGSNFYLSARSIDAVQRYLGYTVRPVVNYTHELTDETKIYLTTDSTNWQVGVANPHLVGSVSGIDDKYYAQQNITVTRGFVVGYKNYINVATPDMTDAEHVINISTTTIDDTNSAIFRGTTTYDRDTTYYYRAYVKVGDDYYFGNVRRYGLELVDMGNGLKWASLNVGAQISSDTGNRYAWGETSVKSNYSQSSYRYYSNGYENIGSDISATNYDVAKAVWGGQWRMPTLSELNALLNTTDYTWTWTTVDGVAGYQVTSQIEGTVGNSIFLPATGYQGGSYYYEAGTGCYYWTSSLYIDGNSNYLHGSSSTCAIETEHMRYLGFAVRPVTTAGTDEGGGGDITGGHNQGGSQQTGGEGGEGTGGAGTGNTGGTVTGD